MAQFTSEQIIEEAYRIVADPARLIALQPAVDDALSDQEGATEQLKRHARHFRRAELLLDRIAPKLSSATELKRVEQAARPVIATLDGRLNLVSVPRSAAHWKQGKPLPDWAWPTDGNADTKQKIQLLLGGTQRELLLRLHADPNADAPQLFRAATILPNRADGAAIELVPIKLEWDQETADRFAQALGLTAAEQAILKEVVGRGRLRLLSEERGTSIGTVRNQLKHLLQKLSLGSQIDLVCLYAGYVQQLQARGDDADRPGERLYMLDRIPVEVAFIGPPTGRPVLFFHPHFGGALATPALEKACNEQQIRLIAPWRPYHERTLEEGSGLDMVARFADRCTLLLDALEINEVPLLGAAGGVSFAFGFAARHSDRVRNLTVAGPFFAYTAAELDRLGRGQRLPIKLARSVPALMRLYLRTVIAGLNEGLMTDHARAFFSESASDMAFVSDPANHDMLRQSLAIAYRHSSRAGVEELMLNASDWSPLIEQTRCPVTVLVGSDDMLAPPDLVEQICARHGFTLDEPVADAGSWLLYQQSNLVLERIARQMQDRNDTLV